MERILIIDDSAFIRSIHKRLAQEAGLETLEAEGAASAMALVRSAEPFEGVLLDLLMPDGDGMELLAQMREERPTLAAIICSADKQRARKQDASELGAVFVPKPLDAERLRAALDELAAGGARD